MGIFTGYYVVQLLCACFVYGVGTFLPNVLHVMKYVGAAYILWLAIHIAVSQPTDDSHEKAASYTKGFLLQFVNIKIWMFGITALTGFITEYHSSLTALVFFEVIIATFGTIATLTWIGLGAVIQKWYLNYFRPINVILALTLFECIYGILK